LCHHYHFEFPCFAEKDIVTKKPVLEQKAAKLGIKTSLEAKVASFS
jgi:hypothetical protein